MLTVTQKDIEFFLDDFEKSSVTELLEGKEKQDLEKIAEARGIVLKGSRDLAMFKTIYAFTDKPNDNGARLPEKDLLKVLPQIVGKPFNYNHNRRLVLGHYIDYRYIQSEKTVIVYGIFYKSNFPELWEKAKELFKAKKLSSSFEIWSPKNKRKILNDGTFEMNQMEIAGGALVYQDKENKPAFAGADVLAIENATVQVEKELIYATKHKEEDIITANYFKQSIEENLRKLNEEKAKLADEATKSAQPAPVVPIVNKIKCSHCQEEFEINPMGDIKCPKCFAILDSTGTMKYPPQIRDYNINCPACRGNNWLILKSTEEANDLKCQSCAKEWTVTFNKENLDEALGKISFLYLSQTNCIQCGYPIPISGKSGIKCYSATCKKCGLSFNVDIEKLDRKRQIKSIEERREEPKMTEEQKVEEKPAETPKEVEQPKEEQKVADVQPKVEEAKPVEPKVEPKEAAPAEEIKKATVEEEIEIYHLDDEIDALIEEAKKLSYQEKKSLPDSDYAVVKEVENKVTGKPRKVRMFVISDEAHVRNALARLPLATESLRELGVSPTEVKRRILKRAEELNMKDLLARHPEQSEEEICPEDVKKMKKHIEEQDMEMNKVKKVCESRKKCIKKAVCKIRNMKKSMKLEKATVETTSSQEIAKINTEAEQKIKFYKDNAILVLARRQELGDYSNDISDQDMIDNDVYEKIKLQKENDLLKAKMESGSDKVATLSDLKDADYYAQKRAEIDAKAFGLNK